LKQYSLLMPLLLWGCTPEDPTDSDECLDTDETADTDIEDDCPRTELDWGYGGGHMLPGSDCLDCHDGSEAMSAFTIGGTVFESATCPSGVEGATVHLEDVNSGATLELTTNEMGNFYSDEALAGPFWISVEKDGATATMEDPGSGSCNSCHREGSTTGFVW
jgi:hypothetical protein